MQGRSLHYLMKCTRIRSGKRLHFCLKYQNQVCHARASRPERFHHVSSSSHKVQVDRAALEAGMVNPVFFIGAGASAPFKIPTMQQMVRDFEKELQEAD